MSQNITAKQRRFLLEIASGQEVTSAAKAAGVARETASRWLRLPEVQAELSEIETQATAEATRKLATLLSRTVDELEALLTAGNLSPTDRLRTIRTILDVYPRMAELTRIDARLAEIERILADDPKDTN